MGVKVRPAALEAVRQRVNRWSGHPAARPVFQCICAMAGGFVLAGAAAGRILLPLPLALSTALGLGVPSFAAYAGGCLGYALFWGVDAGLEPMAAGLLAEACLCIFGDQLSRDNRWFAPGAAALFTVLVGFLFLLEQRFAPSAVWQLALRTLAAGGGCVLFRQALEGAQLPRWVLLAALCSGLSAVSLGGFSLGMVGTAVLCAAALPTPSALPVAALGGLALELQGAGAATAIFLLAALAARERPFWLLRCGLWLGTILLGILLTGTGPQLLAAALVGLPLSQLFPAARFFEAPRRTAAAENQRLELAAGLFGQLSQCLAAVRPPQPDPEMAAIFDQAADQVCRLCSQFEDCWGQRQRETCAALDQATPAMTARGKAVPEDLPIDFTGQCRHLEGFLGYINRALEEQSCKRQYRYRLRENRAALLCQYQTLAHALSRQEEAAEEAPRFIPELCCRSAGKGGAPLSGDQVAGFQQGKWYYLLLCDGMGAGRAARAEASAAIALIRQLLQTGATAAEALTLLNSVYLLRDDGAFATVDLLQADLTSGQASLYKWGGAPSYLKRKNQVEKIGTASPPPGIGVGEAHHPEEAKLSLAKGELLVLMSDGAGGEAAERMIRQYGGHAPQELASGILSCSEAQSGEDDRTAAVLALRRNLSL